MSSKIKVLYEDSDVIVFNKPSGVLVVPAPKDRSRTLDRIIDEQFPANEQGKLHVCHRLDRDTSGVIIFARGQANLDKIMDQFRNGTVQKTYIAFVRGKMKKPAGEIKSLIRDFHEKQHNRGPVGGKFGPHPRRSKAPPPPPGKPAVTRFKVVEVRHHFTIVEVYPLTGRTNQIRIHMGEIGHPILGERLYALGRDFDVKFPRVALHAREVTFKHPVTGKKITVEAELAKDMENFLIRY